MKFTDKKPNNNLCCLALGNPGSGKSTAIASFADSKNPMYVFDCDSRLKGIWGSQSFLKQENYDNIETDEFFLDDGFLPFEDKIIELLDRLEVEKENFRFKSVVFDSVYNISSLMYKQSQNNRIAATKKDPHEFTEDQKKKFRVVGNTLPKEIADYKYADDTWDEFFKQYIKKFNQYCNVFVSGWTMDRVGKADGNPYGPDIILGGKTLLATPKISAKLPGFFDEVWEFDKELTGSTLNPVSFVVKFKSSVAKTAIVQLNQVGKLDLTNKNFKAEYDKILSQPIKPLAMAK